MTIAVTNCTRMKKQKKYHEYDLDESSEESDNEVVATIEEKNEVIKESYDLSSNSDVEVDSKMKLASVRKSKRMKKEKKYYEYDLDESTEDSDDEVVASTDKKKNEIVEMVPAIDKNKIEINEESYEFYFNDDEYDDDDEEEEYEQIAPDENGEPIMFWDYENALIYDCAKCDGSFSVGLDLEVHIKMSHPTGKHN